MSNDLLTIIAAALGAGGLGVVIVNGMFGRKKNNADSFQIITASLADTSQALMELAETRIVNLTARSERLEGRIDTLEKEIKELRAVLVDREQTIQKLQLENFKLQNQVDELKRSGLAKDQQIQNLTKQVQDLTKRLNALTNGGYDEYPGPFK